MKIQIYTIALLRRSSETAISLLLILSLIFGYSCQSEQPNSPKANASEIPPKLKDIRVQSLKQLSTVGQSDTYEMTKQKVEAQRSRLKSNSLPVDSLSKLFEASLLNQIIPFWEGTTWSFEGHTPQPKSGSIACGYFVSTTLQDIGLNVNRYKLAQQSPINEARSLAINTEVKVIAENRSSDNMSKMKSILKEGIHFIGFDESHVGYILKKNDHLYLIHSNYINAVGVQIEQIEQSEVFKSYIKFYIVELSTNEHLLHQWKNGEPINF